MSRAAGDIALAVFGVLVIAGAVAALKQGDAPASPAAVAVVPEAPSSSPSASATPSGSASPSAAARVVVVAGPDLGNLSTSLASATGYRVVSVPPAAPEVLAPGALDHVTGTPSAVILEVLAGSQTTNRTTAAIRTVTAKWPDAHVLVIGPFSSNDRKSAAAAKTAAAAGRATFLDPVLLTWRSADSSPLLTAADEPIVTAKLALALT